MWKPPVGLTHPSRLVCERMRTVAMVTAAGPEPH